MAFVTSSQNGRIDYAFVGHGSACEALRLVRGDERLWPDEARNLPLLGGCVSTQGQAKALVSGENLDGMGIRGRPIDLLVPTAARRSSGKLARFHLWSRKAPRHSFLRVSKHVLVSSPELTIVQLCGSQAKLEPLLDGFVHELNVEREAMGLLGVEGRPAVELPTAWENTRRLVAAAVLACEFAGTYRLGEGGRPTRYGTLQLMSMDSLKACVRSLGLRSDTRRALEVADLAFDCSASPRETALALMLSMPVACGGFGLPKPQLNREVDVSHVRGILSDRDAVTPDFLWEDAHVALEYDSDEFHRRRGPMQLANDAVRANILTALDYKVLRVTPMMVRTQPSLTLLARQVARCLNVELEEPDDLESARRRKAFLGLFAVPWEGEA